MRSATIQLVASCFGVLAFGMMRAYRPSSAVALSLIATAPSRCCSRRPHLLHPDHHQRFDSKEYGTAINERGDLPPLFRYRILSLYQATEDLDHPNGRVIPALVKHFAFASRSQARKACRHGNIVLLRQTKPGADPKKDDDPWGRDEHVRSAINHDGNPPQYACDVDADLNSQERGMIDWDYGFLMIQDLTKIRKGDLIARITREPNSQLCYSEEMTKFVFPPSLETSLPSVVYQDDDMAVVYKPEGLTTIGTPRKDLQSTLPFVLLPPHPSLGNYKPRPVHRLDRGTCGLVLIAKSAAAASTLSRAFAERTIQKTYTALVFGSVVKRDSDQVEGIVDYPIDGKDAISHWKVLKRTKSFTLLSVKPKTGRMHQIRRHLSYCLGTPIVGDSKYDNGGMFKDYRKRGLFLCSSAVKFQHPSTGKEMGFSAPLPDKFAELLASDDD